MRTLATLAVHRRGRRPWRRLLSRSAPTIASGARDRRPTCSRSAQGATASTELRVRRRRSRSAVDGAVFTATSTADDGSTAARSSTRWTAPGDARATVVKSPTDAAHDHDADARRSVGRLTRDIASPACRTTRSCTTSSAIASTIEYDTGARVTGYLASCQPSSGPVEFVVLSDAKLIDSRGRVRARGRRAHAVPERADVDRARRRSARPRSSSSASSARRACRRTARPATSS